MRISVWTALVSNHYSFRYSGRLVGLSNVYPNTQVSWALTILACTVHKLRFCRCPDHKSSSEKTVDSGKDHVEDIIPF